MEVLVLRQFPCFRPLQQMETTQMPSEGHKYHTECFHLTWELEEHTRSNHERSMLPSSVPPCEASSQLKVHNSNNCDTTGEGWKVEETARQDYFLCTPFLVLFSGEW